MLRVEPISLRAANAYVERHHRHHTATRGHKFSVSVLGAQGQIRGVSNAAWWWAMSAHSLARRTLLQGVKAPLRGSTICKKLGNCRPMGTCSGNVTILLSHFQKVCSLFDIRIHTRHLGFQVQTLLSVVLPIVGLGPTTIDACDDRPRNNQGNSEEGDHRTRDQPATQGQPKACRNRDQRKPDPYETNAPTDPVPSTHKGTLLRRCR